ncbi:hypothetical protein NDU88_004837 [Pleurodeles waltl]|uniref:Nuclear protein MDM1 n=1 Tax=Pleurodeles waltl TaxID=8319 RepID=A0AAV7NKT7_PLEWA|nr:hypothetical protein NDU88_004837 [Pleurodeles waltl]
MQDPQIMSTSVNWLHCSQFTACTARLLKGSLDNIWRFTAVLNYEKLWVTLIPCDGPDWADPHTAPTCSAAASREPDALSSSSNHDITEPSQREPRCLKGPQTLPGRLAFGSDVEERKMTDGKKKEGVDDRESRDVSRGSPSWAEPAAPSADYRPKENTKKPVIPSRDEGDRLREAGRECQPHFRRSVAGAETAIKLTQETCAQAHISIAINQAGEGKQKSHEDKNMEDSHNAGPKEYKADTDQVLSNGKDCETGKDNSIPAGEEAASLTSETESTMGLEQSAMVERGDVPWTYHLDPYGRRSISWAKRVGTRLHVNNNAPKPHKRYNREVMTSPATWHQIQDVSIQGPSNQLIGMEQEGREEEYLGEYSQEKKSTGRPTKPQKK